MSGATCVSQSVVANVRNRSLLQPHDELEAGVRDPHEWFEEWVEDPWELRLAHLDPMGLDFESVECGVSPEGLHRKLVQVKRGVHRTQVGDE